MNLWNSIEDDLQALDEAQSDFKAAGNKLAKAEVAYQIAKNKRALELKNAGQPATIIQLTIKGDKDVAPKLLERECAQVDYDTSKELVNVLKKRIDTYREQLSREWNYNGRGM